LASWGVRGGENADRTGLGDERHEQWRSPDEAAKSIANGSSGEAQHGEPRLVSGCVAHDRQAVDVGRLSDRRRQLRVARCDIDDVAAAGRETPDRHPSRDNAWQVPGALDRGVPVSDLVLDRQDLAWLAAAPPIRR